MEVDVPGCLSVAVEAPDACRCLAVVLVGEGTTDKRYRGSDSGSSGASGRAGNMEGGWRHSMRGIKGAGARSMSFCEDSTISAESVPGEVDGCNGRPRCSGKSGPAIFVLVDRSGVVNEDDVNRAARWFTSQFHDHVVKNLSNCFSSADRVFVSMYDENVPCSN